MNIELLKRIQNESGHFQKKFCFFIISPSPFNVKIVTASMTLDGADRILELAPVLGSTVTLPQLSANLISKSSDIFLIEDEKDLKLLSTSLETIGDLEYSQAIRRVKIANSAQISTMKIIRNAHGNEFSMCIRGEGFAERSIESLYYLSENVAICKERHVMFAMENDRFIAKIKKSLFEISSLSTNPSASETFIVESLSAIAACRYPMKIIDSGNTSKRPKLKPTIKIFSSSSDAYRMLEIGSGLDPENIAMTRKLEGMEGVKIAALTFKYGSLEFSPGEEMKHWISEKSELSRRSTLKEADCIRALARKKSIHLLSESLGIFAFDDENLDKTILSLSKDEFELQILTKIKKDVLKSSQRKKSSAVNWFEGADDEASVYQHPSNIRSRIQKRFRARSIDPSLKLKNEALSLGSKISIEAIDEDFTSRDLYYQAKLRNLSHNIIEARKDTLAWFKSQKNIEKYLSQVDGITFLLAMHRSGLGSILADQMGLGKTLQALACMQIEMARQARAKKYFLVVAKKTVLGEWTENDAKKIDLSVLHQYSATGNMSKSLREASNSNLPSTIFAITPEFLRSHIKSISKIKFEMVFIDESQEFFSKMDNKTYVAAEKIARKSLHCLSGSPAPNRIGELFAQIELTNPGLFPRDYSERSDRSEIEDADLSLIWKVLMLSRSLKKSELPRITRKSIALPMPRDLSSYHTNELNRALKNSGAGDPNAVGKFLFSIRPKLSCHVPSVRPKGTCAKSHRAHEIVIDQLKRKRKTIIFSEYKHSHDQLSQLLKKSDISHRVINGNMASQVSRRKVLKLFNSGEIEVLILSKKVACSGLNIQGAQSVILMEPFWNLATDDQCIARAYRRGQTKPVEAFSLYYENSTEEKVIEVQNHKKRNVNNGLNPAALVGDSEDSMQRQVEILLRKQS